jgi:hypothetical protein
LEQKQDRDSFGTGQKNQALRSVERR